MDRKGRDSSAGDIGVKEMNALCNDFSLFDVFRHLYRSRREFTWADGGQHGQVLCRLDRFYLCSNFKKAISRVYHSRVLDSISDHCCVVLYLDLLKAGMKLGKGFWKV